MIRWVLFVQRQGNRIDEVLLTIQSLKDRVDTIEENANTSVRFNEQMETNNGAPDLGQRTFNPSVHKDATVISVIVSGLPVR